MEDIYRRNTKNLWFPWQKEPPSTDKDAFKSYWSQERDRLMHGFYLCEGSLYISGWLYWHTVYWTIEIDTTINGKSYKGLGQPLFRDIDWDMSINKERAEKEQKIIELVGARRFGKSVWNASIAGYYYTLFKDAESCMSAGNAPDIRVVTDKIESGLTNLHPVFQKQRLKSNWKDEVRAGFKDKKTGNPSAASTNSRIVMRNFQDGNNTMACNGLAPKFHVIDEIGKIPNLIACVMDTMPCWMNSEGMFSIPIISGTGGDMEVGKEAGDMFFSPGSYNILEFDDIWEHRGKIGWFMSVTKARNEYKHPKKLYEYLGITNHPSIDHIEILVSDEQECMEKFVTPRRINASRSGNPSVMVKEKAYWPIKPSESFLVLSQNPFNTEDCEKQLFRIKQQGMKTGTPVELRETKDGKVYHVSTDKTPVTEFPLKDQNPDAAIVVYEFPISENPPWGLYIGGIDPYKQDQAKYSDSLGAVFIFKRIHNIMEEKFQDMIVASYVAKPASKQTWFNNARLLLKWYNATALCENEDPGFIDYMIYTKKEGHYLVDQPEWLKEIHATSQVARTKGLHVTPKIRAHLNGKLQDYLTESLNIERNELGEITKETLGCMRILDPMLLEEIITYNATGNFDRVVAASLAITLARKMDPDIHIGEDSDIYKSYFSKNDRGPMFRESKPMFTKRRKMFN